MIYKVVFFFKKCYLYEKLKKKKKEGKVWDVMGTVIERC